MDIAYDHIQEESLPAHHERDAAAAAAAASSSSFRVSILYQHLRSIFSSLLIIIIRDLFSLFSLFVFFLKSVFGVLLCCLHSVTRGSNKFSHVGIFDVYILRTAVSSGSRGRYSWLGDALLCKLQAARGNRLQQTLSATNRSNRES